MNKLLAALVAITFSLAAHAVTEAAAPSADKSGSCEEKAVGKNGKPLAGAAKKAFLKKCEGGDAAPAGASGCEGKALSKSGKPLAGAAKTAFLKKCAADAAAAK